MPNNNNPKARNMVQITVSDLIETFIVKKIQSAKNDKDEGKGKQSRIKGKQTKNADTGLNK